MRKSLFLIIGFLLLACTKNVAPDPHQLVVASSMGSAFFTPFYAQSAYDRSVTDLVYQSLYKMNEQGELLPIVAEGLPVVSHNGQTYTITLKENNFFSNGHNLTAFDVEHTYALLANPNYYGPYRYYSQAIQSVTAINPITVQFVFKKASVTNPMLLLFPLVGQSTYSVEALTQLDKQFDTTGSGPYQLQQYQAGQFILLTLNPYYKQQNPDITSIKILIQPGDEDVTLVVQNQADLAAGLNQPAKIELAKQQGLSSCLYKRAGYNALFFNTSYGVTQNPKVRQALAYGLNRSFFQASYLGPMAFNLLAAVNPEWPEYDEAVQTLLNPYNYNPGLAQQLLEEEGYLLASDGYRYKEGKVLEITWLTSKDGAISRNLLPIVTSNYKDLGIKLYIVTLDTAAMSAELAKLDAPYNMVNRSIFEESRPYLSYQRFYSENGRPLSQNLSRLNNPLNQQLSQQLSEAQTEEQFKALFQQYLLNLNQLVPVIVLNGSFYADIYNSRLGNYSTSSSWTWRDQAPFITLANPI